MKFRQRCTLPSPRGPHAVGCTTLLYQYEAENGVRLLPCLCWYPAAGVGTAGMRPYVDERVLPGAHGVVTHTELDVPVADGVFPLIAYNHGPTLCHEINTVQHEELASHGYVVVAVGHQGQGAYVLPNGDFLPVEFGRGTLEAPEGIGVVLRLASWIREHGEGADLAQHRAHYQSYIDVSEGMVDLTSLWTRDTLAALDCFLANVDRTDSVLHGHVDPSSIGAFGYSFGGSTAVNAGVASSRVVSVQGCGVRVWCDRT